MNIRPPSEYAVAQTMPALRALADAVAAHLAPPGPIQATPFEWCEPAKIRTRDAIDFDGLAANPIGNACRAEIRRIGAWLAPHGSDTMEAACETATADEPHRAVIISAAWADLSGWHA